jgi:phosphohistidine phosphatase SixA
MTEFKRALNERGREDTENAIDGLETQNFQNN